jgi:hypothetical protein
MPGQKASFLLIVGFISLAGATYAQSCVNEEPFCEKLLSGSAGTYIENPECAYINHGFLQSDTPSSGPSEGVRVNPIGQVCGAASNGLPCGVRTTNNSCAESAPVICSPLIDPTCLCPPEDSTCGGGFDPPCDPEKDPCDDGIVGKAAFEAALQRAALNSPMPGSVRTLLQTLAHVHGIYLKARVTFTDVAAGTKSTAIYEYWERDGRYRIRLDPALDFPWSDIAFDGKLLQGRIGPDAVEVRPGDDRLTPLPDGPLTLALAPLRVNDPTACRLCQLRLQDFPKVLKWRQEAPRTLATAEGAIGTGGFAAGALRTGTIDADGRLIRESWPPDEQTHRGSVEITLGAYEPIAGTGAIFPKRLTESLTPTIAMEYAVETIDLSPTIPDEVFDIFGGARKIIYGAFDKNGSWHGRYARYSPTPGLPRCTSQQPATERH